MTFGEQPRRAEEAMAPALERMSVMLVALSRVPQLNDASGHADRHRRRSPTRAHPEAAQTPGHTFEPCSNQPPAEMQTRHVHGPSGNDHNCGLADMPLRLLTCDKRIVTHGST